ncbi:MAG TPA: hypothetical protein VMY77_03415 [Chitinophagaceae bacterium]|nr:hypothetical protein [Chitinophagaceae bacterium]
MKFSHEIFEELNAISPLLAGIGKKNVFSVPEGYFDELTVNTLKSTGTGDFKTIKVPEGYFESLATSVLDKIRSLEIDPAAELRTLSPMLYSIQNENVFSVPRGYFNNLEKDILDKVTAKPQAKVVELKKRNPIWKYAVAAVITGVIGVSSFLMFNTPQATKSNEMSVAIKEAGKFKNEKQLNGAIATLSDDEIIKYLEKTGTDIDNEALAAGIDENALPEAKDYMLDENILETYLNETNKNSQN